MPSIPSTASLLVSLLLVSAPGLAADGARDRIRPPFLSTGVRVGEVSPERARVWARLTARPERNEDGFYPAGGKKPKLDRDVADLQGACPGTPGSARVVYAADPDLRGAQETPWKEATAASDFVVQFALEGLRAQTRYSFRIETRAPDEAPGQSFQGSFTTAPLTSGRDEVVFTVVTGMAYRDLDDSKGFQIYESMAQLEPDFLVATGDTVYYDSDWPRVRSVDLARYHWHRMYSLPRLVEFHRRVPGYWIKDDHDTLDNDCWPGKISTRVAPLTFEEGQGVFREQTPFGTPYRTIRWGRHLQVWIVEGRDFRSPNTDPDGPEKTIWGEEQKRWLKKTILASDATFRVLLSATPIVGPDRAKGKNDNHSNRAFAHEGQAFRSWVRQHLPDRFYVVCGDRHWQYHSVDPVDGVQEFSSGPASDGHAGGSPGLDDRYHRFHRVEGGFLSVTAGEDEGRPSIAFRFHAVDGTVVHEHREVALEGLGALGPSDSAEELSPEKALSDRLRATALEMLGNRAAAIDALRDPEAIAARQEEIRNQILGSFGGFPPRSELTGRVVGRVERKDHIVEKVIYESLPGFHVTANLYLPKRGSPPYPVILFPCGHSSNGKAGSTYQTAGQEFARRGFAVFVYDPIGQGERFQYLDANGKAIVGGTTEHTITGTAALLVGSNTAEVIIWDGIRGVDYLETRSDIDVDRLGSTGNSGGGTQTSYLMALESRIQAAAPSCYLTTLARLFETIGPQDAEQNFTGFVAAGLDHADFVHAFAPRPALICCASQDYFDVGGTWTTFREAKRIYGRLGHPGAVDLVEVDAKHGYHLPIRQRVGRFFEETLMNKAPANVVREVEAGTIYPDAELQCTETGQVVSALGGRTVADLWREEEARLRPQREKLFRELPREEWLRGVRELAAMADEVTAPSVRTQKRVEVSGVVVEQLSWDEGFLTTAVSFAPHSPEEKAPNGIEILVDERGADGTPSLARLHGRAESGEVIIVVTLPGYGAAKSTGRGERWGHDWKAAFLGLHVGRPLAGIRADAVRQAVAFARARYGVAPVGITGIGRAAIPALLAGAMEPAVTSLRLEGALDSWHTLVERGLHNGRLGNVVPGALAHFDLPLLRQSLDPRPVEEVRPADPEGRPLVERRF